MFVRNGEARLNVTWAGANGDFPDPIPYDATDAEIRHWAAEAIRSGSIPGIRAGTAKLSNYVVDRFPATGDNPVARVFVRPKTPFGVLGL